VIGIVVVVGIAAVIAVAAGSGGDDSAKATDFETGRVAVEGSALPAYDDPNDDRAVGDTIPTLTGTSFDGSPITVGPNGKPQVLVFLSHSCPHCQAEVPRIVALQQEGKLAEGVDVTAIATNTSSDLPNYPPSAWLERERWPFPVLADSKSGDAGAAYGLTAFPYFVFVDADGRVVGRATGELAPEALTQIFERLAAGTSSGSTTNGPSTSKDQ
jgi:thiol-disulfide isomerase/thioredoxin